LTRGGTTHCLRGFVALIIFVAGLALPFSQLHADTENKTAELTALSLHPEWLALLHYEVSATGQIRKSYAQTNSYFLAKTGNRDPAAELKATLEAFSTTTALPNQHALCRFPGRRRWIEANSTYSYADVPCPEFNAWAALDTIDSVSMVFATGHFASPASFFGHNFLKINKANSADYLIDTAINFGALIPPNENPITYLATGIFGGYEAEFSAEPFYRFLAKYGEKDLRDVWEYKLALSDDQRNLLISHLWELRDVQFPYYFFRENCAYHISALLNLVVDQTFVPRFMPWAMPVTVFDSMMSTEINGNPLVADIELHRSRRTLFQNRYAASSVSLKKIIHQYSLGQVDLQDSLVFQNLSEDDKIWIIDTLLDYSAFMSKEKDGQVHKDNQQKLLLARLHLKQGAVNQPDADKSRPPHLGQRPSYTSIGVSQFEGGNATGFLRIRPAYYDFLSLEFGRKPHASFTLFDTQINFTESVSVASFDLVSLSNLNTQFSNIAIDKASSWQFRIGNQPVSDKCDDCNRWIFQWDLGKSRKFGQHLAGFALAGIAITESRNQTGNGALQAHIGLTGRLSANWQLYSRVSYSETFNRHQPFHTSYELENRFGNSRWWDIRIKMTKRDLLNTTVSAAIYW